MLLDEIVSYESQQHMSVSTGYSLTLLHIATDMNATLRVVQGTVYTVYPNIHSVCDYSIYTFLEIVKQNWRKPIYSVVSYYLIQHGFMDSLQGLLNFPGDRHPQISYQQEEEKQEDYYIVANSDGKVQRRKDSSPHQISGLSAF